MKKKNTAILIIVILLVVMFGIGEFFAFGTPRNSVTPPPSSAPTSQAIVTHVVAFSPSVPAGAQPVSGSCWTNSIAAPYRTDAWRCTVGNAIQDPCFEVASSTDLLCDPNPAVPDSTSSVVLKLSSALPTPETIPGGVPSTWAWLVQLADGTLCSPFTGTLPPVTLNDQTAGYSCAPGPLGNNLVIFGDLNNSSSEWSALVGDIAAAHTTSGPPVFVDASATVPVAAVWQ